MLRQNSSPNRQLSNIYCGKQEYSHKKHIHTTFECTFLETHLEHAIVSGWGSINPLVFNELRNYQRTIELSHDVSTPRRAILSPIRHLTVHTTELSNWLLTREALRKKKETQSGYSAGVLRSFHLRDVEYRTTLQTRISFWLNLFSALTCRLSHVI